MIDQNNFIPFLRHISNQGQGESWQRYIRGEFTTPYIRGEVNNPNKLFNGQILSQGKSQPDVTIKNETNVKNIKTYVGDSTMSNSFDFTDLYPITNLTWDQSNLANGQSLQNAQEAYDTKDVLRYNESQKTITNLNVEIRDLKIKNKELENKLLEQPKESDFTKARFHGSSNLNDDLYK